MNSGESKRMYALMISQGLRYRLFEIDELLAGKECPYRLTPEAYDRAKNAIADLFHVIKEPELEVTPKIVRKTSQARGDVEFQRFLGKLTG